MRDTWVLTEAVAEREPPLILNSKKSLDGTPKNRLCADFRELNLVIQVPVYTKPLVKRISID
jgi:hypothetical protein